MLEQINAGVDEWMREHIFINGRNLNGMATMEKCGNASKSQNVHDPALSLLGIYPKTQTIQKHLHTQFIATPTK